MPIRRRISHGKDWGTNVQEDPDGHGVIAGLVVITDALQTAG